MDNSLLSFSVDNNFNLTFSANIKGIAAIVGFVILLFIIYYLIKDGKLKPIKRWFQNHPIEVKIEAFGIEGKLFPFAAYQKFAWKLYVELATRVTTNPLKSGNGIYREALNSLYEVFKLTRASLTEADPSIAHKKKYDQLTLLNISIIILNDHLRPFLSKWHPLLQLHESQNKTGLSIFAHEQNWAQKANFEDELEQLSKGLAQYVESLTKIADIDK